MAKATGFTQEEIEEDRDDQFEGFHYTLTCDVCGQPVLTTVLSRDFDQDTLFNPKYIRDMFEDVVAHNMTHYVPLNTE